MKYRTTRQAFTLVELSIVLVILGLLVGGVLTGQSLIRAAELRSVSTEYSRYITAVNTFRDKYFALPGDMANATSYWGQAAAPGSCATTTGTGTQTCNGNGDGVLDYTATTTLEGLRFWQHLANAGLIEGNYDGISHGATTWGSTKANVPSGKISGSLWFVWGWTTMPGRTDMFDVSSYGNTLEYGTQAPDADPYNPILKPEEAYNIDMKLDDGRPGMGKMLVRANPLANCTTAASGSATAASTAEYLLTGQTNSCVLLFRNSF